MLHDTKWQCFFTLRSIVLFQSKLLSLIDVMKPKHITASVFVFESRSERRLPKRELMKMASVDAMI
jgi:hypothetical protein